jgi:hypothetical protein
MLMVGGNIRIKNMHMLETDMAENQSKCGDQGVLVPPSLTAAMVMVGAEIIRGRTDELGPYVRMS